MKFKYTRKKIPISALSLLILLNSSAESALVASGDTSLSSSNDSDIIITDEVLVGDSITGDPLSPSGSIFVSEGTKLSIFNDGFHVGRQAGTAGLVSVEDAGSTIEYDGFLYLGEAGYGQLNVTNGGNVNLTGSVFSYLARQVGSSALVNIDGTGSALITEGAFAVGEKGTAILNVDNGARFSASQLLLGYDAGGVGTANVSNGSQLISTGALRIGADGDGIFNLTSGGQVISSDVTIGTFSTSSGSLLIDGTGSQWEASGSNVTVGNSGQGQLTLANGGTLIAQSIVLASRAGSTGILNIGSDETSPAAAPGNISAPGGITFGAGSGVINFNHTSGEYVFLPDLSGTGTLNIINGTTTLAGTNTYSGLTSLTGGELKAGAANTFSAASNYEVERGAKLNLNGFNQTVNTLNNAGIVSLAGNSVGNVLTVAGDYTGNDGLLVFNSSLGDDNSNTDRLIVQGNTSGSTKVQVNNLGGTGANTLNGIELISVGGNSAGEFTEAGRIVAGAYDYHLERGEGSRSSNWYLSNKADNGGGDGGDNGGGDGGDNGGGDGGDNGGGDGGDNGGGDGGGGTVTYRPEAGAYANNMAASNRMFDIRLSDRQGETQYTDPLTGEKKLTSMWLRNSGDHTRTNDSSGQLKTQENSYVLMLGGDLASGNATHLGSWRFGALAGYGYSRSNTVSDVTGYWAKGQVEGYTAGLYASWYGEGNDLAGPYLDTLVQYSWFTNRVNGEDIAGEKYDASGLQTSIEGGWVLGLSRSERMSWYLKPNAQIGWSGVKADDHREANGGLVQSDGNDNVRTRLGVRLFGAGHSSIDDRNGREFRPFIEANWIHNSERFGVRMDDVALTQAGTSNIGEMQLGVEGKVTPQLNINGTIGQQIGDDSYSNTGIALGIKYTF
jgi:autotransporter family porin